jgi:hypothetical protein
MMAYIDEMSDVIDRKRGAAFRDDSKELMEEELQTRGKHKSIRGSHKFDASARIGLRTAVVDKRRTRPIFLSGGNINLNN